VLASAPGPEGTIERSSGTEPDQASQHFELLFEAEKRVLLVRFGRTLSDDGVTEMQETVQRYVEMAGRCPLIIDFSAVDQVRLSSQFIGALGRRRAVMHGEARYIVAPSDELFGVCRMFEMTQATATGDHPQVLRSLAAAFAHLGLDKPRFEPAAMRP
jgi:hypothetical protein